MKLSVRQAADAAILRHPWCELISHDLYGIAERLREIEDGYFVLRNRISGKTEVHSAYNKGPTYCFTVPFDELDARTLEYCKKTRASNTDRILKEIEEHNKKLEEKRFNDFTSDIDSASYEAAEDLKLAQLKDELHEGYRRVYGGIK